MREALAAANAPVVAVSPFVGGRAVKGPTETFCVHAGIAPSARGIAEAYAGVVDGIVADEPVTGLPALGIDTMMDTPESRERWRRRRWMRPGRWLRVQDSRPAHRPMRTLAVLPVKGFATAKARLAAVSSPANARCWRRACSATSSSRSPGRASWRAWSS